VLDDRFLSDISQAVSACGALTADRIVLELTERSDFTIVPRLPERIHELRTRGFEIAVDDMGAGTNGLHMIAAVRPDWLKIDRELISEIDGDSYRRDLLRSLASFARDRGIRVVAEGVERPEELAVTADLGIGFAQGFLIGRPETRSWGPESPAITA
jgi:EAL domain-containing protein (putative c-di-GMP-specific phosphodiesterase class I)